MITMLNSEQEGALKCVLQGHNLCLMGAAGTGKTFLINQMVRKLSAMKKTVAVTATTGIACCLYDRAMTIHKWCGIGDGRYNVNEVREVVEHNVKYSETRQRILKTDVLIIDECSMMSKQFFNSLCEILKIKNAELPFGGIQVITAGDFRQLPPVPNQMNNDDGDFCFTSKYWDELLPHKVTLKTVLRQKDPSLIKAIEEVSDGNVSCDTSQFLDSLKRPLPESVEKTCVKLFSKNDQVDDYNRKRIIDHPGQLYEFKATDSGDTSCLSKMLVPHVLWLKVGAPIILLRNLSDTLVNGLQGEVWKITQDGPIVEFPTLDIKVPLEKVRFSVFSPSRNIDVATREQYPVKLAFAITIHKSQGMTLDSLVVDCRGIFKPGQLGVALGRASHSQNLRVINYTPNVCIQQPEVVKTFLSGTSAELKEDRTCCRLSSGRQGQDTIDNAMVTVSEIVTIQPDIDLFENEDEEFDSEFDTVISKLMIAQESSVDLPSDLDIDSILHNMKCDPVVTPMQFNTNEVLTNIDRHKLHVFVKNEFSQMSNIAEIIKSASENTETVSAKSQTEFYRKVHEYQTSLDFRINCLSFFENEQFTEEHLHICYNLSTEIRKFILKKMAEPLKVSKRPLSNRSLSHASRARVRYVGGYCLAKVRHKYSQKKRTSMYKTDEAGQTTYEECLNILFILDSLRVEEQQLINITSDPDSLTDISRRQNKNRSLTSISDSLFDFFLALTELCLSLFVDENLNRYGPNVFQHVMNVVMEKDSLYHQFNSIVKNSISVTEELDEKNTTEEMEQDQIKEIFKKIIKLFLMVMLNQFRKDLLENLNIQKKMAHRKQVRVSSKSGKSVSKDKGKSKTKEKGKSIATTHKGTKRKLADIESDSSDEDNILNENDDSPKPSTSGLQLKKGLENERESSESESDCEDDSAKCKVCDTAKKIFKGDASWIQCDGCDSWLHRVCAGLKHHMKWKRATRKGSKFFCNDCQ